MTEQNWVGQDSALGTQTGSKDNVTPTAPEQKWKRQYDDARKTEQVKLSLLPEDAIALRLQARQNARSISAHVARLVATAGDPVASKKSEDRIADASQVAAAIHHIPNELRSLRLRLNSLGGLIKSLFIRSETVAQAQLHADECAAALDAILRAADSTVPICGRIEEEFSSLRMELASLIVKLARD